MSGVGQHGADLHHRGHRRLAGEEHAAHAAVLREVVQVAEVLHELEDVAHAPAGGLHRGADAVQHEPALREDGPLLDVGGELARLAQQRARLGGMSA
jgi:hypothetical protein